MSPYVSEGTLKTDSREVAISETWETQTDWEAYQQNDGIAINNGILSLDNIGIPSSAVCRLVPEDYDTSTDTWTDRINGYQFSLISGSVTKQTSGIGGQTSVYLDGNAALESPAVFGSDTVTIIAVVQTDSTNDYDGILDNCPTLSFGDSDGYRFDFGETGSYRFGTNTSFLSGGSTGTTPVIYAGTNDGANRYIDVNDSEIATDGNGGSISYNDPTRTLVGAMQDSGSVTNGFDGQLGEILVCSPYLTDSELSDQYTRLNAKYSVY